MFKTSRTLLSQFFFTTILYYLKWHQNMKNLKHKILDTWVKTHSTKFSYFFKNHFLDKLFPPVIEKRDGGEKP